MDITGPLTSDVWSYGPPLPSVRIEQVASLDEHGWKAHYLGLHTLAGTYIETGDHLFDHRESIADVSCERFVQTAYVAHLDEKAPLEPITAAELSAAVGADLSGNALLISTGWERRWHERGFIEECPYLLPEAMDWIIRQDVSLLGLDIPCAQDPRADDGTLNRLFFQKDRLLLAPLVYLRNLHGGPFTLVALPLKIPGVCGTPCRAVLIV